MAEVPSRGPPLTHPTASRPRAPKTRKPTHVPSTAVQTALGRNGNGNGNGNGEYASGSDIRRSLSVPHGAGHAQHKDIQSLPPLKRFAYAKQEITSIFRQFSATLSDTAAFLKSPMSWKSQEPGQPILVHEDYLTTERELVNAVQDKVNNIHEAVSRNHMKVVFIGRTSCGKSTTINGMLHARILPSGIGHTTNCFCSLQGTDSDKPYLQVPSSDDKRVVNETAQLAEEIRSLVHALYPEDRLGAESVVELYWPRQLCTLLGEDVVIIDSPGLDMSYDYDKCIDEHCLDADLFVLVADSKSTLNETEKKFFRKVAAKISTPNVFVQYNQWDCIDDEDNENPTDLVKNQHLDNARQLLCDELRLIPADEISTRCFFVSAREAVSRRRGRPVKGNKTEKDERYREFERFEACFEECVSTSAIKTRFYHHATEGLEMAKRVADKLREILAKIKGQQKLVETHIAQQKTLLHRLQSGYSGVLASAAQHNQAASQTVKATVETTVAEQVKANLGRIVAQFRGSAFNEHRLDAYKTDLCTYVSQTLEKQLLAGCQGKLAECFVAAQQGTYAGIQSLLPDGLHARELVPPKEHPVSLTLDCSAMTETFQEDIQFRFSLGWETLGPQLFGENAHGVMSMLVPRRAMEMLQGSAATDSSSVVAEQGRPRDRSPFDLAVDFVNSPAGAVAVTLGSMALSKPWTLKAILFGCTAYLLVYGYERACYTTAAKERRFKQQFLAHAARELKVLGKHTASYASQSITRDLSQELAALLDEVRSAEEQMTTEVKESEAEVQRLSNHASEAERLRRATSEQHLALQSFGRRYTMGLAAASPLSPRSTTELPPQLSS